MLNNLSINLIINLIDHSALIFFKNLYFIVHFETLNKHSIALWG